MADPRHPIQPLVEVDGVLRFKVNQIVRDLLDFATDRGFGLNQIATRDYTTDDRAQLMQLIGYSHDGTVTMGCISDELWYGAKLMYEEGQSETEARLECSREEVSNLRSVLREFRDKLEDIRLEDEE